MKAKLTLILNEEILEKARKYALDRNISLSMLMETYLQSLTGEKQSEECEISSFVKSLVSGSGISADLDYKKEYSEHLEEKHR